MRLHKHIKDWCYKHLCIRREPDLYIGGREKPYMLRWYVIPRNPLLNVYFHIFLRSDYAEALHDHPWIANASILLDGDYTEVVFKRDEEVTLDEAMKAEYSGVRPTKSLERKEGAFYFRWGKAPHRVQLHTRKTPRFSSLDYANLPFFEEDPCSTLFITGPKIRKWGFYCPKGWKPWFNFLDKYESAHESIESKGCD